MTRRLLDPGLELTLRPMAYPRFYEMYRDAIKNTWTVEEVDFSTDLADLYTKMSDGDRHLVERLVAFFATDDRIHALQSRKLQALLGVSGEELRKAVLRFPQLLELQHESNVPRLGSSLLLTVPCCPPF